ncbi:YokU family protein [Paenibacillus solisilvae]|uniref:YokU family protein n=1 Tax=Paenibacillus solisilvae TaxID=2486751 RepID=A0ABW0VSV7_9BACL
MNCIWCETEDARESVKDCYWIMPDGKLAVEILEVPAIECPNCLTYVTEAVSQQIEEALYWHDVSALGTRFRYEELMKAPRIKNIFLK